MAVQMIHCQSLRKYVAGPEARTRDRPQSIFILRGDVCNNSFFFLIFDRNSYEHTL